MTSAAILPAAIALYAALLALVCLAMIATAAVWGDVS